MLPLWAHRVDWKWLHPCNWMQFYPTFANPRADIQSLGQHSGPERAGSDATKRTLAWRVHCCVCICVSSVQNLAKYLVTSWHFTYSLHSFFKVHMFYEGYKKYDEICNPFWHYISTRGPRLATVFGFTVNGTIGKTALSRDCFSTKITDYDFWIFKVPLFC